MLRFLRTIRKHLLEDRKFTKYLLYAIGEILLVVIGILLALQIDSWNEERTLRKKERLYLQEIRTNLYDDLDNVHYSIVFNHKKDSAINACLNTMLNAASDGDAMAEISRNMPVLTEYSVFTQNRVAFDNMLSAENIDLISDHALRTQLSTYYSEENLLEGTQERVKQMTRIFVDNITPMLMTREVIQYHLGVESNFASGNDLNFTTNRVLFGDLFGMQRNIESHIIYLKGYERIIDSLLLDIDQFLLQED